MALVITDDKHYKNIADAIRAKTGINHTCKPEEMTAGINDVYEIAHKDGEDYGYASGKKEGIEEGKIAERNTFWDIYQLNGTMTNYMYAFYGTRFDDTNFYPRHDIKPLNANYMFGNSRITKLKDILEEQKVVLDTSAATNMDFSFYYCRSKVLPEISTVSASTLTSAFAGAHAQKIEKLILKNDGSQTFASTFIECTALTDIAIEGTIGQSISFKQSPLTNKSFTDNDYGILHHLKDYSGTSTTKTLTLSTTSKNNLSDAEKAIAIQKGWTIA